MNWETFHRKYVNLMMYQNTASRDNTNGCRISPLKFGVIRAASFSRKPIWFCISKALRNANEPRYTQIQQPVQQPQQSAPPPPPHTHI